MHCRKIKLMRYLLISIFFSLSFSLFSQRQTTFSGIAPGFIDEKIDFYEYEDYISFKQKKIGEALVKSDSTFSITIYSDTIKKIRISIGNYYFHTYLEPSSVYNVFLNGSLSFYKEKGTGYDLDYYFLDLDSSDINFKILTFENKLYSFLQENYNHKNRSSGEFSLSLEKFKTTLEEEVSNSDDDIFYLTYLRFSMAQIDDLPFNGSRNRYEKYDFYIKPAKVWYYNDKYMEYISQYYKGYYHHLPNKLNQSFYEGILRSSPSLLMRSLSGDYALDNLKLRELVVVRMLSELYYDNDIPQTNVRVILDSLSSHAAFEQNRAVAKNILGRVTDLVPGGKSPDFSIQDLTGKSLVRQDLGGKSTYIHFLDGSTLAQSDFDLLKKLNLKYGEYVRFITIVKVNKDENLLFLQEKYDIKKEEVLDWTVYYISDSHYMYEKFKVSSYPHYVMLDESTNIRSSPAISPRPNNEYETIERVLFNIKKQKTERK